ncbi:MAG: hypothetical protein A2V66_16210 [Ignavibacteria bacterium RBG_13_36_8]|nr:MAG: hypothetical protein A2V66_16210 [Ignavibacteria bacterium RBG_13_36_8]
MSQREQQKYFDVLKRYEKKFDSKELEDYKMFIKRHKDDEDLDRLSMEKLKTLYEKYHANRERKNYDHLFKKPDGQEDIN